MSAHTPGPWFESENERDPEWLIRRPDQTAIVMRKRPQEFVNQDAADARLIAAAPDLLDALRQAVEALSCGDPNARLNALRDCPAVIAKATTP